MSECNIPFWKMNGAGNKIIVADLRASKAKITPKAAIALAGQVDTQFDQIMEVNAPSVPELDADIRILNADGSEAEACGNGTRCVTAWLNRETAKKDWLFKAAPGLLKVQYFDDSKITVDMGVPKFEWEEIPLAEEFHDTTGIELQVGPIDNPVLHTPSVANIGNPHAVFWVEEDVWSYALDRFGPLLENHPIFPDRANISIAQVPSRDHIILRTWERGTGLTLACGSAACAALVCAARKGLTERAANITAPGGELHIEWNGKGRILMTGPAEFEFSGKLDPASGVFVKDTAL